MSNCNPKGEVVVLGIDLAKQSFQLHGIDANGTVVIKKSIKRKMLSDFIAKLPPCIIGMEACGGSNH